jgi:hypothetical protein
MIRDESVAPEPNRLVQVPQVALARLALQLSGTKSIAACKDRTVAWLKSFGMVSLLDNASAEYPTLKKEAIKNIALILCIVRLVRCQCCKNAENRSVEEYTCLNLKVLKI